MKRFSLLLIFLIFSMILHSASALDIPALEEAAQQGDIKAQFQLGIAYYTGDGVKQNYQTAVKWFLNVANAGFASAQHNLGVVYSNGQGVPQNFKEAVKWYRKAAEQGDVRAQNNLARLYQTGQGVVKNAVEAVNWYQKAAKQGYAIAQYNLGLAYHNGQGVSQDDKQAIEWFSKAAAQGHVAAQSEWDNLKKANSPESNSPASTSQTPTSPQMAIDTSMAPVELITALQPGTPPKSQEPNQKTGVKLAAPIFVDKSTLSQYVLALNYSRPQDQAVVNQLASFLTDKGYAIDHIGYVATEVKQSQWDIRYYHENYQPAVELKTHLQAFLPTVTKFEAPTQAIQVRDFSFLRGQQTIEPGRMEIWLLNPTFTQASSTVVQNSPRQQVLSQYILSLQYANRKDHAFMQQLADFLKQQGYRVDRVGRAKVPAFKKAQWDIRYYYDQQAAATLKSDIEKFSMNQGIESKNLRIRDFSFLLKKGEKIRPGRMEVWILNP